MAEWSDYFEDFPEENPANYVNGRFDPKGAAELRARAEKTQQAQAKLNAEISGIISKHAPPKLGGKKRGK